MALKEDCRARCSEKWVLDPEYNQSQLVECFFDRKRGEREDRVHGQYGVGSGGI